MVLVKNIILHLLLPVKPGPLLVYPAFLLPELVQRDRREVDGVGLVAGPADEHDGAAAAG